jgi:HEAT repeat protein
MMRSLPLLLLASFIGSASAAPARPSADTLRDQAALVWDLNPEAAKAIVNARPLPRRDGQIRWIDAPTGADVAAVWLDLALHEEADDRIRAARAVAGALGASIDQIEAAYAQSSSPKVRAALLGSLRNASSEAARLLLIPALDDPDAQVRHVAIVVLTRREDAADFLRAIRRSTLDGSPAVRADAAFGLGVHGSAADAPAVDKLTRDPDATVRLQALRALSRLDARVASTAAARLAADPDPRVSRAASKLQPQ